MAVINNSVVQAVSVFAITQHFVTESGGDISLTNSNSNFGAKALSSDGFRDNAFTQMILDILRILFHQNKFLSQKNQLNLKQ